MEAEAPVVLLGPPGTVRDVVSAVLALEGFVLEVPAHDRAGAEWAAPGIAVSVMPGPDQRSLVRRWTGGVVLVAERSLSDDEVLAAVLKGVDAVVTTDTSPLELRAVVETVGWGGTLLAPAQTRGLAHAARSGSGPAAVLRLTSREQAILRLIEEGQSVKQTARTLGITAKTVENLQSRLFRKLGARNRAHAVALARDLGFSGAGPGPPDVSAA